MDQAISEALRQAERRGVHGKELTPFLLERVGTATEGKSIEANVALLRNHAAIGAQSAGELAALQVPRARGVSV